MMGPRKPYFGQRKLILAFDVGTTSSGISYCILVPGQIPEIRGVTRFPGQHTGSGNAKVPSVLYYDDGGSMKAAGNEALEMDLTETAVQAEWMKAEWWKFHLRPNQLVSSHIKDDIPPLPGGKSVVDVLSDFIKYLFQGAKTYIEEHHMGFNWPSIGDSIEFVFTLPNDSEGRQREQYRLAIQRAGLVPNTPEGQSHVHLITESEANLHYCLSSFPPHTSNTEPKVIVVIDAGGGTIDLSMYSIMSNPISCCEIAPAECRLKGSVFVTRRATDLLKRKLQGSPHCSAEEMNALTREFDRKTKPTIVSADKPVYLKIGTPHYNNPQYNITRGALKFSGEEVAGLFDETVDAIIAVFDQQRRVARVNVSTVFLVGGLGTNDLIWNRLQSHFEGQGIELRRPDHNIIKAVANGALLARLDLETQLLKSRVAPATYGIPHYVFVDENDPEHLRRKGKWEKHSSGRYRIPGAFDPLLHKGDPIDELKEIRRPFSTSRPDPTSFADHQMRIVCYRGALDNPRWLDEDASSFSDLCTIRADLRKIAQNSVALKTESGETYYQIHYNVVIVFGSMELSAQIAWWNKGTEESAPAAIVYQGN